MNYHRAKSALVEICKYAGSGNEKEVKKILDEHPSLINEDLTSNGWTVLLYAASNNYIKIIKLLLSYHNIQTNIQSKNGWTALHHASTHGHKDIVELLLSYNNVNINIQNNDGWTALHYSSNFGHKDIVKLLLSHPNIDINIKNKDGKLARDICCDSYEANKLSKTIILELFKNHSTTKTPLTLSPISTATSHSIEGSPSSNNVIPQAPLKESNLVVEVKDRDLLIVVEEKEGLQLPIEGLEEKTREITNNNMKEMERHSQEKENSMKEMDYMKNNETEIVRMLQENSQMMDEMKKVVNNTEKRVDEKDKKSQWLEERIKQVENMMNKLESRNNDLERRLEEKEKECVQLGDQIIKIEDKLKQMESNIDKAIEMRLEKKERSLTMKPLTLPPKKQTHVFLTHTWREDEKGRNNHDRVGRVNEALRKRGLVTWFDSERLDGNIHETISKALYSTCCVLIFVTREYEKKVNSADDTDYCFYEFNVAATDPELANTRIPIVMDESMLNPVSWDKGLLKAGLGGKVFIDVSSDDKDVFEERCNEVFVRVVKLLNI